MAAQDPARLESEAESSAREVGIPPCPAILARFQEQMASDEPDLRALARLIGSDVGLSAALVKTVNAPFYGLARKATTVQGALSILGLRTSANLVARLLLRHAFPDGHSAAMARFWAQSLRMVDTALELAPLVDGIRADEAATYVLFRDSGMAVMLRRFAEYGDFTCRYAGRAGKDLAVEEEGRFHYSHSRVGHSLARGWQLADSMCRAILLHHDIELAQQGGGGDFDRDARRLVAFGLLAEQVYTLRDERRLCPDWKAAEGFVFDTLGMDAEDTVALIGRHGIRGH